MPRGPAPYSNRSTAKNNTGGTDRGGPNTNERQAIEPQPTSREVTGPQPTSREAIDSQPTSRGRPVRSQ